MHRRIVIYIILITVIFFGALGCQKEEDAPLTQEEFQAEYIEMLNGMGLYFHPDYKLFSDRKRNTILDSKLRVADGVEIREELLKIHLHVYTLDTKAEDAPMVEELADLYHQYDEEVYQRFYKLFRWYLGGGNFYYNQYDDALFFVYLDYRVEHGESFNNIEWGDMTAEDMFEMEGYIKENPNFEKQNSAYKKLMYWLGIENPDATPTPK